MFKANGKLAKLIKKIKVYITESIAKDLIYYKISYSLICDRVSVHFERTCMHTLQIRLSRYSFKIKAHSLHTLNLYAYNAQNNINTSLVSVVQQIAECLHV